MTKREKVYISVLAFLCALCGVAVAYEMYVLHMVLQTIGMIVG